MSQFVDIAKLEGSLARTINNGLESSSYPLSNALDSNGSSYHRVRDADSWTVTGASSVADVDYVLSFSEPWTIEYFTLSWMLYNEIGDIYTSGTYRRKVYLTIDGTDQEILPLNGDHYGSSIRSDVAHGPWEGVTALKFGLRCYAKGGAFQAAAAQTRLYNIYMRTKRYEAIPDSKIYVNNAQKVLTEQLYPKPYLYPSKLAKRINGATKDIKLVDESDVDSSPLMIQTSDGLRSVVLMDAT